MVAAAALARIAAFAIIGPTRMEPFKYALMLFYVVLYGGFGLEVSLLLHRRFGRNMPNQVIPPPPQTTALQVSELRKLVESLILCLVTPSSRFYLHKLNPTK